MDEAFHGRKKGDISGKWTMKHAAQPEWHGAKRHHDRIGQRHGGEGFPVP